MPRKKKVSTISDSTQEPVRYEYFVSYCSDLGDATATGARILHTSFLINSTEAINRVEAWMSKDEKARTILLSFHLLRELQDQPGTVSQVA